MVVEGVVVVVCKDKQQDEEDFCEVSVHWLLLVILAATIVVAIVIVMLMVVVCGCLKSGVSAAYRNERVCAVVIPVYTPVRKPLSKFSTHQSRLPRTESLHAPFP